VSEGVKTREKERLLLSRSPFLRAGVRVRVLTDWTHLFLLGVSVTTETRPTT
jgi:hypothetical protein